jgi:excisionase family DNA binding protein
VTGHDAGKPVTTLADLAGRDFADTRETAAILRVQAKTIRRWIREGKIPATFVGEYRVPVTWLRERAGVPA